MKPQPGQNQMMGGREDMMQGRGGIQQMLQQRMRQQQNPNIRGQIPGLTPMTGGPGKNMDPAALQQLIGRSRDERNTRPVNDMPRGPQGVPFQGGGFAPPGLGNIQALMQQRQMGAGGMNPFAQRLQQTGMNPAVNPTVTASLRPGGMSDTQPFAPRLRFNNPNQQGPANPEDAQRARYQQALGGFRGFGR